MAQDSAPDRRSEDTRAGAAPAGDGQDEIPAEIQQLPEGSPARRWALEGYNRAREARARVDALQEELRHRDELVTTIATRAPQGDVRPEHTPKVGEPDPEFTGDAFDPNFRDNLATYVKAVMRRGNQAMADWYIDDRAKVWEAVTNHQARLAGMNGQFIFLSRDHPELRIEDFERIFAEAPRHDFQVPEAYAAIYKNEIQAAERKRIRTEVEREVRQDATSGRIPDLQPPPVLGGAGPVPRRAPGGLPRPRTWGEATREAQKSAAGKLLMR
jgi:hypothetical protein